VGMPVAPRVSMAGRQSSVRFAPVRASGEGAVGQGRPGDSASLVSSVGRIIRHGHYAPALVAVSILDPRWATNPDAFPALIYLPSVAGDWGCRQVAAVPFDDFSAHCCLLLMDTQLVVLLLVVSVR
jgi:hypothetical protein